MKDDKPDSVRPKTDEDKLKLRLRAVLRLIAEHKVRNSVNTGREKLTWFAGNEHRKLLQLFVEMEPAPHESAVAYAIRRGDLAHSIAYWQTMEREALEDLRKLRTERNSILWKLHLIGLKEERAKNSRRPLAKPENKKQPKKPAAGKKPKKSIWMDPDEQEGDDYDAGCR